MHPSMHHLSDNFLNKPLTKIRRANGLLLLRGNMSACV